MMSAFSRGLLVLLSVLSIILLIQLPFAKALPNEAYGTVKKVVDGDTFDIAIEKTDHKRLSNMERIRIADVNSPEMDTAAGPLAKDFSTAVLLNKKVYLDIDDRSARDPYGRLVCVVYLAGVKGQPIMAPCFNRMLVDSGQARLQNFANNEFDPSDWWPKHKLEDESKNVSENIPSPQPSNLMDRLRSFAGDLLNPSSEKQNGGLGEWIGQAEDWLRRITAG